jgi:uncharacterized membrane protein
VSRTTARIAGFLVYLLPLVGWALAWFFMRRQNFVFYHACQSLGLTLAAILAPAVWVVLGWLALWIPFFGPLTTMSAFALVVTVYIVLLPAWIMGMLHALRLEAKPVPVFGNWGNRLYLRFA